MMLVMIIVVIVGNLGYAMRFAFLGCTLIAWVGVSSFARKEIQKPSSQSQDARLQRDALRVVPWDIPLRDNIRFYMLIIAMILLSQILLMSGFDFSGTVMSLSLYIFYAGIVLMVLSVRAREPGQISCDRCSYPLTGLTLPCMCPECGVSILDESYTTDRPRVRWGWLWQVGVVTILLGGSLTYLSFAKPAVLYSVMPRGALSTLFSGDEQAFAQLISEPMTIEEKKALIDSLIEQSQDDWVGSTQRGWLVACYLDGSLQPDQLNAIMEGLPPIELSCPETVKIGQSIEVALKSSLPSLASGSLVPTYFFRGFVVDPELEQHGGSEDPRPWISLIQDRLERFATSSFEIDQPRLSFAVTQAGRVVVRARVVLVLTDLQNIESFAWDEEGEGTFEQEPDWIKTIDLERVIEVEGWGLESG
ncbi:MAG: hypothetical protein JJ974_01000 [Phycisphaerales bacterium]|nr:hypothetical protein [Phycisphaerales bacterium]